jgi:hypothetical protein
MQCNAIRQAYREFIIMVQSNKKQTSIVAGYRFHWLRTAFASTNEIRENSYLIIMNKQQSYQLHVNEQLLKLHNMHHLTKMQIRTACS